MIKRSNNMKENDIFKLKNRRTAFSWANFVHVTHFSTVKVLLFIMKQNYFAFKIVIVHYSLCVIMINKPYYIVKLH